MATQTQLKKKIYRKMEATRNNPKVTCLINFAAHQLKDSEGDQVIEACDIGLIKLS